MDPEYDSQWGEFSMNVKFSQAEGCYVWDCIWGCHGTDYESHAEAQHAYVTHRCDQ